MATLVASCSVASPALADQAKNVFLFISDGAGFNHFNAGAMYQYGFGNLPYEQKGWTKYGATTYPLRFTKTADGLGQDPTLVYDAKKAWDTTSQPVDASKRTPDFGLASNDAGPFAGYNFVKTTYTDSAAAGTAIATGQKTYNSAVNLDNDGKKLKAISEIAKDRGLSTGVVSSVYFSHATPATIGGAHSNSRKNLNAIANEMLDSGTLDLIMSPNNSGKNYDRIGGQATYDQLKAGTHAAGWDLIEKRSDFKALANGTATPGQGRLIGLAEIDSALQYSRPITKDWNSNGVIDKTPFFPSTEAEKSERQMAPINPGDNSKGDPFNDVPTLATMTKAAINHLDAQNGSEGIFLMVEGSHIDWAGHGHNTTRLIEEQVDFNNSIQAAMDWIQKNDPDFSETLIIVTADHEAGMVWGPNSDTIAFDKIKDNGVGNKPGMIMNSTMHTNEKVPMYAKGVGAELFAGLTDGTDSQYLDKYGMTGLSGWGDEYIDITDIFTVMDSAMVPEPSSLALLGLGSLLVARRRRSA